MRFKYGLLAFILCAAFGVSADDTVQPKTDAQQENTLQSLVVYKSPTCGCCVKWIEHLEAAEFSAITRHPVNLNDIKRQYGIAPQNQSCHTAVHESGYIFEGHVPAEVMTRFLADPVKESIGLAVPGMPMGSPGMEYGDRVDPYTVRLLMKDGSVVSYATVNRQGIHYNL